MPDQDPFKLFVSSVRGFLVPRLGAGLGALIGARRVKGEPNPAEEKADVAPTTFGFGPTVEVVWDEDEVFALTDVELATHRDAKHGNVYERYIAEGALRRRTREEWEAFRAQKKKEQQAMQAKLADEAKKKAEEAAKAGSTTPTPDAPKGR